MCLVPENGYEIVGTGDPYRRYTREHTQSCDLLYLHTRGHGQQNVVAPPVAYFATTCPVHEELK